MFMKDNLTTVVLGVLSVVAVATAQPKVWIDDFQTVTTYDSASLLAPLYEGPPTKYTIIEILISDIFNSRAVSGDDSLTVDHRNLNVGTCSSFCFDLLTRPHVLTVLGVLGLNIGQPGEPPLFESSVKFTSADLCIYGGLQFSPWQVRGAFNDPNDPFGPDGLPGKPGVDDDGDGMTDDIGVGGVDDDSDGTTDEPGDAPVDENESPALWSTSVGGAFGNSNNTGFEAGMDRAPGAAGVDANDFLTFSVCFNGSLNPPKPICQNTQADLDLDGDVDGDDFRIFSNCFNGALKRPSCMPVDLTNCPGGGQSAMGGGGSLLAQSAVQLDPFLVEGMTPAEDVWYLYTPTCTGNATLALCDATRQGRSVDGIRFAFFDGTAEEVAVVPATACGQSATETVPMVAGQTVSLLVYRDADAESLDGFTLSVTCGQ